MATKLLNGKNFVAIIYGKGRTAVMRRGFRAKRPRTATLWTLAAALLLLIFFMIYSVRVLPVLKALALNNAGNAAIASVNNAVGRVLSADKSDIAGLVQYQKDDTGKITAVQADPYVLNKLKYDVIRESAGELNKLTDSQLCIPLGDAVGGPVFTNRGPKIAFRLSPFSIVNAEFSSAFSSAGINQTRLRITLTVKTNVSIIIASCKAGTDISSSYCLIDTVIIGSVPDTYMSLGQDSGSTDSAILGKLYSSSAASK